MKEIRKETHKTVMKVSGDRQCKKEDLKMSELELGRWLNGQSSFCASRRT